MLALLMTSSMLLATTRTPVVRLRSPAAIQMAIPLVAESSNVHLNDNEVDMRALRDRMVAQMAVDAASTVAKMELIDLGNELKQVQMSVDDLTSQNVLLARENDELTTQLQYSSPGYIAGMPFTHSLANCVAHGRCAAIAARADALWLMRRSVRRVLDVRRAVVSACHLLALRAGLRLKPKFDNVQRSWKLQKQRAHAGVARATTVCARGWLSAWAWTGLYGQMAKEAAEISADMQEARKAVAARS